MNGESGRVIGCEGFDLSSTSSSEHLGRRHRHVFAQRQFVLAISTVNFQCGHAPSVNLIFIQFDEVTVIRETLTETSETKAPWAWTTQRLLEFSSEAGL